VTHPESTERDLLCRLAHLHAVLMASPVASNLQVVLSVAALHKGLLSVVANSLVGSILSNLLLVMGECGMQQQQ